MGTRSAIFIKSQGNNKTVSKWHRFYKHWDGYPTGNLPLIDTIATLHNKIKSNSIKSLVELSCQLNQCKAEFEGTKLDLKSIMSHSDHGDLEWVYILDLDSKEVKVFKTHGTAEEVYQGETTNPLDYVKQLLPDYRANEERIITEQLNNLVAKGYKVA